MNESLSPEKITRYLRTTFLGRKILCFDVLGSTNCEAARRALAEEEGTVIISEQQTTGRGRFGRKWQSPGGKGIWMSIILKPQLPPDVIPQLTLAGAAAVCLAVDEAAISFPGRGITIKWPNDLFLNGKKAGGILTEMSVSSRRTPVVVIGIGLNVNLAETDFPDELKSTATSLRLETGREHDRTRLTAGILNGFEPLYLEYLSTVDLGRTLTICRERSEVIGRKVVLENREGPVQTAEVIDLGPKGELVVRLAQTGEIKAIISGEISVVLHD
ncbi:MAG: biotin--[acetyl-CoA-carboxylase] ligase [Dehalobacter sp. 4CP]|uniref:biotin--[acetyl-CoA-carboxylase] ligase n=1 Tax=Dehalobacter sp. CP TaxID=2594474 RepID=UPI0013CD306C|nr:biotin--[acetyl-CoA-carboxylase] ligase [Dehalobacter sp. 4CP]